MDNDKTMKRKSIGMIVKNLILLLSVAITGVIGAWSWFSNNTTASAKGISVSCEAPDGIEIAVVEHGAPAPADKEYSTRVTLDETSFLAKLVLSEITGDGIAFYSPTLTQMNGVATPSPSTNWEKAVAGTDYVCFDLYIRTKKPKKVYLASESSVLPIASRLTWDGGTNTQTQDNASTYGYFSKDSIIGATRVSILGYDKDKKFTKKLLWIPRPDICLQQNLNSYSLSTKLSDNIYETYTHMYWNSEQVRAEDETAIASYYNSKTDTTTLNKNVEIADFDVESDGAVTYNEETGYYYTNVVYNTWIEGEDKEARLALSGGKFKINLQLTADIKQT